MHQDLSSLSKGKKVREVATRIIKDIREVCENNGETLWTVLAECSFMMTRKDGQDVRETVTGKDGQDVRETMVTEKGARKAFEKLVSEGSWNERVKCMRVPDWMYRRKNWGKIKGFLCKLILDLINFWKDANGVPSSY